MLTGLQDSVCLKLVTFDTLTHVLRYKSSGILHIVDRLTVTEVTKEQISSISRVKYSSRNVQTWRQRQYALPKRRQQFPSRLDLDPSRLRSKSLILLPDALQNSGGERGKARAELLLQAGGSSFRDGGFRTVRLLYVGATDSAATLHRLKASNNL